MDQPLLKEIIGEHIAGLMGEKSAAHEQISVLTVDEIPQGMPLERIMLSTIYALQNEGLAPSPLNARDYITTNRLLQGTPLEGKDPAAVVEEIWKLRSGRDVNELSARTAWALRDRKGIEIGKMVSNIMSGSGPYEERYEQASALLAKGSPNVSHAEEFTQSELLGHFMSQYSQGLADKRAGKATGLTLPFRSHKHFFARLKWREFTLILGATKSGKTMLAHVLAEHFAWNCGLPVDVVYFQMETPMEVMQQRQLSRHLGIPFAAMENYEIDFDLPKWASKYKKFVDEVAQKSQRNGHLHYVYCPLAPLKFVTDKMRSYAAVSKATGRKIVFIFDYLQKFDWHSVNEKQNIALEIIGEQLSGVVRQVGGHGILFAQEGAVEGQAFGSSVLTKIAQLTMKINTQVFEGGAPTDQAVMEKGPNGAVQAKDALDNLRFYHRAGDRLSGSGTLDVILANDGMPGQMELLWERSLSRIQQSLAQLRKLNME